MMAGTTGKIRSTRSIHHPAVLVEDKRGRGMSIVPYHKFVSKMEIRHGINFLRRKVGHGINFIHGA